MARNIKGQFVSCGHTDRYSDGHCKVCHLRRTREYRHRFPEKHRATALKSHRKWHYQARKRGMSPQEYETKKQLQHNLCAICGQPDLQRRLSIDHDHLTNKNRALLCTRCNTSIGKFEDDPVLLRKAAAYLEVWKEIHNAA